MASRFIAPVFDTGPGSKPASGSKLNFFETGTSTRKDTFTTAAADTPNANPVIADSNGVFPDIFITGTYKVILTDKNDVQVGFGEKDPVDEFAKAVDNNLFIKKFDNITKMQAASAEDLVIGDLCDTKGFNTDGDGGADRLTIVEVSSFPAAGEGIVWFALDNGLVAEHFDKRTITTNQAGIFGNETTFASTTTYESVAYPVTEYTQNTDFKTQIEFLSNNFDNPVLSKGATFFDGNIDQTKSDTHWASEDKYTCVFVVGGFIPDITVQRFDFDNVGHVGKFIDVEVPLPIASTPAEVADPTNFIDFTAANKLLFGFANQVISGPALTDDYSSHSIGLINCYVNNRDGTIGRSPNAFSPAIRTKNWFVTDCVLEGIAGQGALLRACDQGKFIDNVVSKVWAGVVLDSSRACVGTVMTGNVCKRVSGAFKADQILDDFNLDFTCTGNTFESFEQGKGASFFFARLSAFGATYSTNTFRIKKDYLRFFDIQGSIGDASDNNTVTIEGTASSNAMFDIRNGFPQEIDTLIRGFVIRNESSVKTNFIFLVDELAGTNSNNITIKDNKIKSTNINNLGELIGMALSNGTVKKISISNNDIDCFFISRFTTALTVDELIIKNNEIRTSVNDVPLVTGNLTINTKLDISRNDVTVYPGAAVTSRGFVRIESSTTATSADIYMHGNTAQVTNSAVQVFTGVNNYIASGNVYEASGTRAGTNDMIDITNVTFMSIQSDTYINKLDAAAQFKIKLKIENGSIVFDNRNALLPLARFTVTRV